MKAEEALSHLDRDDLTANDAPPQTSEEAKRCAALAARYGFDGNLFWNLSSPNSAEGHRELVHKVRGRIDAIPKIIAAIENDASNPQPVAVAGMPSPVASSKRVLLFGRSDKPMVDGISTALLTNAQYDVVLALLNASERGLTKDELDEKSGHGDARKILSRLSKDDDWRAVISLPGTKGKGYRLL